MVHTCDLVFQVQQNIGNGTCVKVVAMTMYVKKKFLNAQGYPECTEKFGHRMHLNLLLVLFTCKIRASRVLMGVAPEIL